MSNQFGDFGEGLVLGLFERASDHVGDLAAGTKRWRMCVPPEGDDSDMLLSAAIDQGKAAVEMLEWIWANCRIMYYPDDGRYPIEHHPGLKPMREAIEAESVPNDSTLPRAATETHTEPKDL